MELRERIKAKMLGGNPVPLENLCDLPSSLGYDRVAGTIRAMHGVADDLNNRVEALEGAIHQIHVIAAELEEAEIMAICHSMGSRLQIAI